MRTLSRLAAGAAFLSLIVSGVAVAQPTARVAQGRLTGVSQAATDAFLGIPYARPPVGGLRWKAPAPARAWSGVRKSDAFSASCYQVLNPPAGREPWTPEYLIAPRISEDCLYLNVWAPKGARNRKLPVLFWIHGGGFTEGSGSIPIYDGANLAAKDVIVVTVNYRLDVFGFLAHPELAREAGSTGNYGLMDLAEALRWVNVNISAFGGDPGQVTIAGQSAGAGAVHDLIGMPSVKGLFVRAIAQSGSGMVPRAGPMAPALATGQTFAAAAGASSLPALRGLPSKAVLDAAVKVRQTPGQGFRAVVDGQLIPADPTVAQTAAGGVFNDTPILTGLNNDEGSGFEANWGTWSSAEIQKRLEAFGPVALQAKATYAPFGFTEAGELGKQLSRRGQGYTYVWAKRRLPLSSHPIYLYQYLHSTPGPNAARYGSFHTAEVPYVFRNLIGESRNFTAVDEKVADTVSGYWLNFIRTGNPNGAGLPAWPAFNLQDESVMRLNEAPSVGRILPPAKRDLYEAFHVSGGQLSSR
jgi:para-nitrobenzyl esterase